MKNTYTLTLSWEDMDTLLEAVKDTASHGQSVAEDFEALAGTAEQPQTRQAAKDLAAMYRRDERRFRALEDKLREALG